MREMTTDRPDITETPFTIDAGHLQIESDLLGYALSRRDGEGIQTRAYNVTTTNFRIGLTNWSELSVVVRPYNVVKTTAPDPTNVSRHSGVGGLDLRVKFNLWGNDKFEKPGDTAFALLPAAACTVGLAAMFSVLRAGAQAWTALDVIALLVFLQIGYLCGAGLRMSLRPPRSVGGQRRLLSS